MATRCCSISASLVLLLLMLVEEGLTYSGGAPDRACKRFLPGHGDNLEVQKFAIGVNSTYFSPGNPVQVTLKSLTQSPFKGVILQARIPGETSTVGSFKNIPEGLQYMTCGDLDDTVTHRNKEPKTTVTVTWVPPAASVFVKQIHFMATFVETYETRNPHITSELLTFRTPVKPTVATPKPTPVTKDICEGFARFCS